MNDRAWPAPRVLPLWRMRWRWSVAALRTQLRRWAAFLLVVAAVLGPFVTTLIGWPALPLFWATQQSGPLALAVVVLHALPAWLLAWGLRECLLPGHWLAAERALPVPAAAMWRADLPVMALAQAPWLLLTAVSVLSWWHADPAWMRGLWSGMAWRWLASVLLALALSSAQMQAWRRTARRAGGHQKPLARPSPSAGAGLAGVPADRWQQAATRHLLWLPLTRGPARAWRLGLLLALLTQALLCLALWIWPAQADWVLALHAVLSMAWVSRLQAQARRDCAPLIEACAMLPLPTPWWPRRLRALNLAPGAFGWCLVLLSLGLGPWTLSPMVWPIYALLALLAPMAVLLRRDARPESGAAWWLLCTALWVALSTVVLR